MNDRFLTGGERLPRFCNINHLFVLEDIVANRFPRLLCKLLYHFAPWTPTGWELPFKKLNTLEAWASEVFFQSGPIVDFPRVAKRNFSRGANGGEILFYPLETKRTTFSAEQLKENIKFQTPLGC